MKRKLTAIIAIAAMLVTLIPSMAFAGTNYFKVIKGDVVTEFATAEAAIDSVKPGETAVIELLDNYIGNGIKVKAGQNVTFDLRQFTWDVTGTVGSVGTETNGFQLLSGATVTFKNGTITSNTAKLLFQNYCSLTIENLEATLSSPNGVGVVSNNNGETHIKASTINSTEKMFAIDSDSFGSYVGGRVFIEDGTEVNGDVSVTNGGQVTVGLADIFGDINVTNYGTDKHSQRTPKLVVDHDGAWIGGKVLAENNGNVLIKNGVADAVDVKGDKASAVIEHGAVSTVGKNVKFDNNDVVTMTVKANGFEETITLVGKDLIDPLIDLSIKQGVLAKVVVVKASEGTKYDVPEGVRVENVSDTNVTVNGTELKPNTATTVQKPVTPSTPETTTPEKDKNVKTGDDTNLMLPVALVVLSLIAMAAVVATRRRHN